VARPRPRTRTTITVIAFVIGAIEITSDWVFDDATETNALIARGVGIDLRWSCRYTGGRGRHTSAVGLRESGGR
jgi:hypothetical protein